jgi:DNA-binding response OmpR family regulator
MLKPQVLLVEDEGLVGMKVEDALREAGFDVLGPFARCAAALSALPGARIAAAVTDVRLSDGDCDALVVELRRRGVPTIILSGFSRKAHPLPYEDLPWFVKPCPVTDVVAALRSMLNRRQSA